MRLTTFHRRDARSLVAIPLVWIAAQLGCGRSSPPPAAPTAPGSAEWSAEASPTTRSTVDDDAAASGPAAKSIELSDAPVSGMIGGKQFRPDKAMIENGALTLRQGEGVFADAEVRVFLFDDGPDKDPRPHVITVTGEEFINPHVHVSWKETEDGFPKSVIHTDQYQMTLEFDAVESRQVAGRIDLRLPDAAGSHVAGAFIAEIARDWDEPPTDEDVPYVMGKVDVPTEGTFSIRAGYVGFDAAGASTSNMAGLTVEGGNGGSVASTTFQPRVTTFTADQEAGCSFTHRLVPAGNYLVYMRWDETWMDWKWLTVANDARMTVDLRIDPDHVGMAQVTLTDGPPDATVVLLPLDAAGRLPELPPDVNVVSLAFQLGLQAFANDGVARFEHLRPGHYRAFGGGKSVDLRITSGETAAVELK